MKRIYAKKEEGIASTVGTIFALMIFTSLLSMFMMQVVPVQMKGNEAQHDLKVVSQFSYMRSMADLLTLTRNTNYTAYVPIKLGAEGVTLFASPTYGQLSLFPGDVNSSFLLSIHFLDKFGNRIYANSSGSLQIFLPNRYYVAEAISYENGAIIRYNLDANNASFVIEPNIKFQYSDALGGLVISAVLHVIYGLPKSVTGVETRNIGLTYVGSSSATFEPSNDVNITVRSNYSYGNLNLNFTQAWINYLNESVNGAVFGISGSGVSVRATNNNTTLEISNVVQVNVEIVYFEVEIGM